MFFARAALFLPQNRSKRYARRNASVIIIIIIIMGILGGSSGNNNAHDLLSRTEHLLKNTKIISPKTMMELRRMNE